MVATPKSGHFYVGETGHFYVALTEIVDGTKSSEEESKEKM